MKKTLTDRTLKALKAAPLGKRVVLWDAAQPNFGVRITDKGRVTFIVMRRLNGKLLRRAVGEYPSLPLVKARAAAQEALRDIASGVDPKAKRAHRRAEEERCRQDTFGAVAEEFIRRHVKKLRSGHEVGATIRRELITRWAERPIHEISRRDVVGVLEEIVDSGRPYVAHHVLAYIRKLFNWALARDIYGLTSSPCDRIKPKDVIGIRLPRQRVLREDEIRELWNTTETALSCPFQPFVRMLLITGQRLREVAEMRWDEVDFENALWTIPSTRMKGDAAHEVPLSKPAIYLLKDLPRGKGPHVFSTTDGERPIAGFSKVKERLGRVLGGEFRAWRFHDLRRTMRTQLSGLPIPDLVAELCIGHTKPGLHKVYDQHAYRVEKQRAFVLWADRLTAIIDAPPGGNVVRLGAIGKAASLHQPAS
jgi:integrase